MTSIERSPVAPASPPGRDLPAPLLPFVDGAAITTIVDAHADLDAIEADGGDFVYASGILQDVADYRGLLRRWFALLRIGGRLAVDVPHAVFADRALALPLRNQAMRRRLYTPAALLGEVEEALAPNSYRVRLLCDHETGHGEAADADADRGGGSILLVLERIAPPDWTPDTGEVAVAPPPTFAFEPPRTRREIVALAPRRRIVILKLDHLGDFIMGIPALEKAREAFADAEITLVVGTWNEAMARDLGLFETVVGFDAFPRNSSEETVNLGARVGDFERLLPADYDLAIDLRTDFDTRFFLRHLKAGIRAGLGTRVQFDFLDIFLPIDGSRHGFEAASSEEIDHHAHSIAPVCRRSHYRVRYAPDEKAPPNPLHPFLIFGPYRVLDVGEYLYEPHCEIEDEGEGLLLVNVACDVEQVAHAVVNARSVPQLRFRVEKPGARVEFRVCALTDRRTPAFSFYGGRLLKRGASSVLHQSEYLSLLVDLVAMRTDRFGMLREQTRPA